MKKIGIIGGLGPEATVEYYRTISDLYRGRHKDGDYPRMIIYSMNMNELLRMAEDGEWPEVVRLLSDAIACLHRAGAEFALIAAGTPHIVFDDLRAISPIPLLSIVEETLKAARRMELKRVGLFGTKFTMQSDFFQKIFSKSNIEVIVPSKEEQGYIYEKLLREIALGRIIDETRAGLLKIVKRMIDQASIEGLILGCTELPLILTKDEFGIPFLNATRIHAESAVAYSLSDNG